jgi:hypothetical protein
MYGAIYREKMGHPPRPVKLMSTICTALVGAFLQVAVSGPVFSQEPSQCTGAERYPDPEPVSLVETGALVLQRVSGIAAIRVGDKILPPSQLHGACLSLFAAASHKFVASAPVDKHGRFQFGAVPPGDYRLVARAPGLCTGNDPVRVSVLRAGRRNRTIVVNFQVLGYDSCTSAEYAK